MKIISISKMVHIDADVEVDLDDFETKDLQDELLKRNIDVDGLPPLHGEEAHPLHEIYYAFKFGLTDRATDLARAYVCDALGVVL